MKFKNKIISLIISLIPAVLMLYSSLPFLYSKNIYALLMLLIGITVSGYVVYRYFNDKFSWLFLCISFICILISYLLSTYNFLLILLSLFLIISPLIFSKNKKNSISNTLLFYSVTPLSYLVFLLIVIKIIESNMKYLYLSEEQFVFGIIIFFMLCIAGYSISLLFDLNNWILKARRIVPDYIYKIILFISIIIILIMPDILYSWFIYGLYLNVRIENLNDLFQIYYYNFSNHFITPITKIGGNIKDSLISNNLGIWIIIIHTLTIRFIDITILASVVSLFKKNRLND